MAMMREVLRKVMYIQQPDNLTNFLVLLRPITGFETIAVHSFANLTTELCRSPKVCHAHISYCIVL